MKLKPLCWLMLASLAAQSQALEKEARVMPKGGVDKALLGQILFFDVSLSVNRTQSCATCHNPDHAFIDARENSAQKMVSQGDNPHNFGNRNSPTMLYAKFSPDFHFDEKSQQYVGGQFWDGRAKNLQEQAGMPPLDPLEMGMPSKLAVAERLWQLPMYANLLTKHYGEQVWQSVESVYAAMEDALAVFQQQKRLLAPFDSKYDKALKGEYRFTALEAQGKALFFDKNKTNCTACHQRQSEPNHPEETFTNYHYYNIGTPSNPALIAHNKLPADFVDKGLAGNPMVKNSLAEMGKFKVPTLRNVAVSAPYMHNGVFKELRTVLLYLDHFNNPERKLNPETQQPWASAEYHPTIATEELSGKALTDQEIDALEAFLKTLTDERYERR